MLYRFIAVLMVFAFSAGVSADTQKTDNITYGVVVEPNQEIELTNGVKIMAGGLTTATAVSENGEISNQWCRNTNVVGDDGMPTAGGGYCAIVNQEGDMLFVWFGGGKWGVINGTGGWAGAVGGGTTEFVSQSPDGRSFITKSAGEITTP